MSHQHERSRTVHGVVNVLFVPRAGLGLPVTQPGSPLGTCFADSADLFIKNEVGDQRVLDEVGSNLYAGWMKLLIIPATIRALVVDDKAHALLPGVPNLLLPVDFAQGHDHIKKTDRMTGRIQVGPGRVNPPAVLVLGIEKVVDGLSDRLGQLNVPKRTVAANKHEAAERRHPNGTLGIGRERTPATVLILTGYERAIVVREIWSGSRVQEHAERVGNEFQILRTGGQTPVVPLAQEKRILVFNEGINVLEVHRSLY